MIMERREAGRGKKGGREGKRPAAQSASKRFLV